MQWRQKLCGFYAILDRSDRELATVLVSPAGANAGVLQLRWKGPIHCAGDGPSTRQLIDAAIMAKQVASEHGALFIVNDRIDIAFTVGAAGVHLGQDDLRVQDAVALRASHSNPEFLIGVSTHNETQVRDAIAGGADYLGYGPVFETATKQNPDPTQGIELLARAVEVAGNVPVVAIGGVTPANAHLVASVGAFAGCSIGGVNDSSDPGAAGSAIGAAFGSSSGGSSFASR